jgi:Asp-tRNA(Asn)/Glu-tRNA(Gln) amidotransferase C subunit
MDREFLKISYKRKDKVTTQIEKITEKVEELKDVFERIDVSILPRRDREEILKILKKIEKVPPWKREDEITRVKDMLNKKLKTRGYQKILEGPKLLAVIKYG